MTSWVRSAGLVLSVLAFTACGTAAHVERVQRLRAGYAASVDPEGFVLRQTPLLAEMRDRREGDATRGAAVPPGTILEEDLLDVAVRQDVELELAMRNENDWDGLDGLTVDLIQRGRRGREKGRWRRWVDTSSLAPGQQQALRVSLDDIRYEDGDEFLAEVRQAIPPGERDEYPEFRPAG